MSRNRNILIENVPVVLRQRSGLPAIKTAANCGLPYTSYIGLENGNDVILDIAMHMASHYGISLHSVICDDIERAISELGRMLPVDPKALALRRGEEKLPEGKISGLRYWRKKHGLSIAALAERAGVSVNEIGTCERHGFSIYTHASVFRRLAAALYVRVDELLALHDESELLLGERSSRRAESHRPTNVIDNYRVRNNLTLRAMGDLLGVSRQTVLNYCCAKQVNMRAVDTLCQREGLSKTSFFEKYRGSDRDRRRSS